MIASEAALDNALDSLEAIEPAFGPIRREVGRPRLRKREQGFAGLVAIIMGQQVSTASAAAIVKRVEAHFGTVTPMAIMAASDDDLRSCGLSAPKIRAVRAAAESVLAGTCPIDAFDDWPADDAHRALVGIKGVGPWTADIYLLFCLGHPDAFPAGDLALQEAARLGFGLEARPGAAELAALAERWRPWRGAAATLLWGFYALRKGRAVEVPGLTRPAAAPGAADPLGG
jgi:DNA-3-methyladenine glycosylase II